MYIKDSTKAIYQTTLNQLQEYLKGKDPFEYLSGKDEKEINKILDKFISSLDHLKKNTKATKLNGIRSIVMNELEIMLPKSKLSPLLNSEKLRFSTKAKINKDEVKKLSLYFESEAKDKTKSETNQFRAWRNLILFKLFPGTSQRVSDILALEVGNCLDDKIHFKQSKTGAEGFIDNPCRTEILFFKTRFGLKDSDYLFHSEKHFGGKSLHLDRSTAWRLIKSSAILVLGRKDISPHTFRKYVANRLQELGFSAEEIKTITLHSGIGMVEYYIGKKETIKNTKKLLLIED